MLGGLDVTRDDFLVRWVNESLKLKESIMRLSSEEIWEVFHKDSGGLPLLDKHIAKLILIPSNLQHSIFNLEFRQYQAWAQHKEVA